MKEVKLTNIPNMNIGRIVDDLTNVYERDWKRSWRKFREILFPVGAIQESPTI